MFGKKISPLERHKLSTTFGPDPLREQPNPPRRGVIPLIMLAAAGATAYFWPDNDKPPAQPQRQPQTPPARVEKASSQGPDKATPLPVLKPTPEPEPVKKPQEQEVKSRAGAKPAMPSSRVSGPKARQEINKKQDATPKPGTPAPKTRQHKPSGRSLLV